MQQHVSQLRAFDFVQISKPCPDYALNHVSTISTDTVHVMATQSRYTLLLQTVTPQSRLLIPLGAGIYAARFFFNSIIGYRHRP